MHSEAWIWFHVTRCHHASTRLILYYNVVSEEGPEEPKDYPASITVPASPEGVGCVMTSKQGRPAFLVFFLFLGVSFLLVLFWASSDIRNSLLGTNITPLALEGGISSPAGG